MRNTKQAPSLGALAEQTKSSWAKAIPCYDAVPAVYQDFFDPLLEEGQAFPRTVLTPAYERFLHRTTEKVICEFADEIHVLERRGNTYEAQCFPLRGISYVEVRMMLLDSEIKICGVTKQGGSACSTFKFSSITDYLFRPIVERIRLATIDGRDLTPSPKQETFDHLVRVNYKFMTYARHSLLAGERVIHTILQPEIREPVIAILGKTYSRTVSPTHMTILTDREFITIREEHRWGGEDRYGGIWDYIPLSKIVALSPSSKGSNLLGLTIQLPGSTCLDYLFQASAEQGLDQLLTRFHELTVMP